MVLRKMWLLIIILWGASAKTIDVKQPPYNAPSDGNTDAALAIQRALDDCRTGDVVYIPAGNYAMGQVLVRPHSAGCTVKGDRALTKLRLTAEVGFYIWPENNTVSKGNVFENLDFTFQSIAIKADWQLKSTEIRYCTFRDGHNAIFLPSGTDNADADGKWSNIHHNIGLKIGSFISAYYWFYDLHIDDNYIDGFTQGVSGGGCAGAAPGQGGKNLTMDRNTFIRGQRMALEICGMHDNVSVQGNYITEWRPAPNPVQCTEDQINNGAPQRGECEAYDRCSGGPPYMCDSMAISLAIGGGSINAGNNRIYRQPGTSWGIEYTVIPQSSNVTNIIKNAGRAIVDEACDYVGASSLTRTPWWGGRGLDKPMAFKRDPSLPLLKFPPNPLRYVTAAPKARRTPRGSANCQQTRDDINANTACGGNVSSNQADFANYPPSNRYVNSCTDPSFPAEEPRPSPPYDPATGGGGTTPPPTQDNSLGPLTPEEEAILQTALNIVRDPSLSSTDRTLIKWVLLGLPQPGRR